MSGLSERKEHSRAFIYYLILTAVISGALVMVVEVLGSRVIGPFFGVSLFVWTSLITVTLVALALGYTAGGIISDKKESPDYLYAIILIAGISVLLIPSMKQVVLKACMPLGLRSGALISSLILFGPSLFLLGCVSPYIIKIAAKEMKNIGRTVGVFYAISTVGSFLGTVFTGFVLIAYFSVSRIFEVTGFILICLSVFYFLFFKKKWQVLPLILISLFIFKGEAPVSKRMPDGTKVTEVYSKDGFYGKLKVIDYSYGATHTREMMLDGVVQSGIDVNTEMSIYEYPYFLEFIPYTLNPSGKRCLSIGLGAGIIPMWYERMGVKADIVDIDPDVIDAARRYFGFNISGDIVVSDARYYLNTTDKNYDYIILDVFSGDAVPGHLLSIEALNLVRSRMTPDGILAVNFIGSLRNETLMTASVIRTLKQVFSTIEVYPVFSPTEGDGTGNLAIIAYNRPPIPFHRAAVNDFPVHAFAKANVDKFMGVSYAFPPNTPAITLSDEYNPIDFYDTWLRESDRKRILETTDWEVLL